MPTYQYQCEACKHELEKHQSFSENPLVKCPNCKKNKLIRLVSGGLGFSVKGGTSNSQAAAMGARYIPMDSTEQKFEQRMAELSGSGEVL
jgi:putative FmdB family regulatory protein